MKTSISALNQSVVDTAVALEQTDVRKSSSEPDLSMVDEVSSRRYPS